MFFLYLMACAGITFGIQHKLPFLHKKFNWLDNMLSCTYCSGFHSGWLLYVIAKYDSFKINELIVFAFASAMFSYSLDELVKFFEERSQEID